MAAQSSAAYTIVQQFSDFMEVYRAETSPALLEGSTTSLRDPDQDDPWTRYADGPAREWREPERGR